uniref:translation initiation factor IF-2-like isoform X1 n=1 Tax=Halichoerus grypus TaxID=9711 RepID=UPI001659EE09|nr:translation initiation factor IF-2-like isoform X1 [Halichoerus grypus]
MALEAQPARGALSGEGTEVTGEPDPSWGSSSINRGRLSPTPNSGSGEEGALGAEHASKGPGSHLTLLPAVLVPFTSLVSKTVKGQVGQDGPDPLPALCTASPQGANDSTSSFMQNGDQASGEREKCPGKYPAFPLGPLWTHSPPRRQPAAGGPGPARELAVQSSRNWKTGGPQRPGSPHRFRHASSKPLAPERPRVGIFRKKGTWTARGGACRPHSGQGLPPWPSFKVSQNEAVSSAPSPLPPPRSHLRNGRVPRGWHSASRLSTQEPGDLLPSQLPPPAEQPCASHLTSPFPLRPALPEPGGGEATGRSP